MNQDSFSICQGWGDWLESRSWARESGNSIA